MTHLLKKKYILILVGALEILLLLLLSIRSWHTSDAIIALLIIIGIPLIFVLFNRPWIFIYLVPLTAFFPSLNIGGKYINPTYACIILICLSASLNLLFKKPNYFKNSLFLKPILSISTIAFISFLFAHLRGISSPWVMRGTFEVVLWLLLYQACILFIDNEKKIKYLKFALIIAGTSIALQTLFSYSYALKFSFEKMANALYFIRGGIFGASPNQAAIFIELIFPIVLIYYLYANSRLRRLATLSLLFLMLLAIFSTFSRGAIVGISFSIILITFLTKKIKELLIPIAIILFFLFISSFYLLLIARFETIAFQTTTLVGRIPLFKAAAGVIKDNWLIGIGMNNFQLLKYNFAFPHFLDPFKIQSAHNIYLEMFANLGIIGFIALLWILVSSIMGFKRIPRSNERRKANYIGLLASISTFYIHGFIDCAIANIKTMAVFIIILSLLAMEHSRNK